MDETEAIKALEWLKDYCEETRFMVTIDGEVINISPIIGWAVNEIKANRTPRPRQKN